MRQVDYVTSRNRNPASYIEADSSSSSTEMNGKPAGPELQRLTRRKGPPNQRLIEREKGDKRPYLRVGGVPLVRFSGAIIPNKIDAPACVGV